MDVAVSDGATIVRFEHPPVTADDLLARAIAVASALGQHAPAAYALTKEQLHRPARDAIDAGAQMDARVVAGWKSAQTRPHRGVSGCAYVTARQVISMLSLSRAAKLTLT